MLIKNDTQLKRVMQQAAKQALSEVEEQIKVCIDNYVRQYYTEYTPHQYKRTYQFLRSITKTEVISLLKVHQYGQLQWIKLIQQICLLMVLKKL